MSLFYLFTVSEDDADKDNAEKPKRMFTEVKIKTTLQGVCLH